MPTLDWIGKRAVLNHHREVPYHLLKCDKELSVGDPGSGNLLVQGDNLLALKALLPYYAGKVKCIYIDPPYNTGNENWVYNDNVNSPEIKAWLGKVVGKEVEDLSRHDKWLCMMYPRLALLRDFLSRDGAIFVSIDDNEYANLRLVLDELFGGTNFIATFAVQKRASPDNDEKFVTSVHDHLVCYARSKPSCIFSRLPRTDEADARYSNPDHDPRGPWTSSDLTRREYREHDFYPIKLPSGREVTPAGGRSWAVPREKFAQLIKENRIWFGANGNAMPRMKRFLSDVSEGLVPTTWFSSNIASDNQAGKRELRTILSDVDDLFSTPKPRLLIQRILQIASEKDSLILDSFAGSGTTGHAVLKQNSDDNGTRRFILIEMDEKIAKNVTSERLTRVIDGYSSGKNTDSSGLGGGFRFCTLNSPLFDESGNIRTEVKFSDLAAHVYFSETGEPIPKRAGKNPLLGVHDGRAIYLLFNGVLGDKRPQGGNVLTHSIAQSLPKHPEGKGLRVVYGEACRLSQVSLKQYEIVFRQVPFELKVD